MSDRPTAYLVTAGEYSAYHIVACFDNRAAADAAVEIYNKGDEFILGAREAQVEEWALLDEPTRTQGYSIQICTDQTYWGYQDGRTFEQDFIVWGDLVEEVEDITSEDRFVGVIARAISPERAKRIAEDRVAMRRAHQEGLS